MVDDGLMREVIIRDGTIRLGQFLKLADLIDAGGNAKSLLASEAVAVNGETETRRGRQLGRGDIVRVVGTEVRVG
jgi:ribosome-associated protein